MRPTRGLDGGLQVEPEVEQRVEDLECRLGLAVGAARPECQPWLAAAQREPGHERVHWPLAGRQRVRVAGHQIEAEAAIVQGDTGAGHVYARPEGGVQALDQADDGAVSVGGAQIDRVAIDGAADRQRLGIGRHGTDTARSLCRVAPVEQPVDGHGRECRIGDVRVAVDERQLFALDELVDQLRRAGTPRLEVDPVEHVEHLQQGDPLGVRRQLVYVDPAILNRQRLHPFRALRREVFGFEPATALTQVLEDALAERAAVHHAGPVMDDALQGVGQVRLDEPIAG